MRGYQHLALGATAGLCLARVIPNETAGFVACASCVVGSIYPDIDISTSKLGRKMKPVSMAISAVFGHRGFIHTPVNGAIMSGVIYAACLMLAPEIAAYTTGGFTLGFFLHLLQDTFTRGGIMWLWPVKLKIHFTKISSNSLMCIPITAGLAVICAWLILSKVP